MKNNPDVITFEDSKKGVYLKNSIISLPKSEAKYGYSLQDVNDRIRSYRPNTITNYKPSTPEEVFLQNEELKIWDGKSWNYGEYETYGDPRESADSKVFKDLKILVKSAATLKGLNKVNKVRGGTSIDVEDFFNYATLEYCERRKKQFDLNSSCRILNNWDSYIIRTLPQYLIIFNKSKFDLEIETTWPLVKNEETGKWEQKDFGVEPVFSGELVDKKTFFSIFYKVLKNIPEAQGLEIDILNYLLYKDCFSHKKLVRVLADIVKIQMREAEEEII